MPVNYQDTKIYKLVLNNDLDHPIYIGHTAQKYLSDRMATHRSDFRAWKKDHTKKKHQYFTEDLNMKNVKILLIETFPCNNIAEARSKESYWINEYKMKQIHPQPINIFGGGKYEDRKEWCKMYQQLNQQHISEYQQKYRTEHSVEKKEYDKKYYQENKDQIRKQQSTKKPCELCGKFITARHLARHKRNNCPNRIPK